jgi:hypothetical protein
MDAMASRAGGRLGRVLGAALILLVCFGGSIFDDTGDNATEPMPSTQPAVSPQPPSATQSSFSPQPGSSAQLPPSTQPPLSGHGVHLLSKIALKRDKVHGNWKGAGSRPLTNGDVADEQTPDVLVIHHTPPAEYDWTVRFFCKVNAGTIAMGCPTPGGMVQWSVGPASCQATGGNGLPAAIQGTFLKEGEQHTMLVKVRGDRIECSLDEETLIAFNFQTQPLDAPQTLWSGFDPSLPSLGVKGGQVQFATLFMVEYGGEQAEKTPDQVADGANSPTTQNSDASQVPSTLPGVAAPGLADATMPALFEIRGNAGLPCWLHADSHAFAGADGLGAGEIYTEDHDFLDHDFVFDVLVQPAKKTKDDRSSTAVDVGMGSGIRGKWHNGMDDPGDRQDRYFNNSVYLFVDDSTAGGPCSLRFAGSKTREQKLGAIRAGSGLQLIRLAKTGSELTVSVDPDYNGTFKPAFSRTTDLTKTSSFLSATNSTLFVNAMQQRVRAVRLVIDGQPQPAPAAAPGANHSKEETPLLSLAGDAGLPPWLTATPDALAGPEGIFGGELKSVERDLIDKDFTFDLVYQFKPGKQEDLIVGLGEDADRGHSGWISDSSFCRIQGPDNGGESRVFTRDRLPDPTYQVLGKTFDDPGPHLFRLQKCGNTLTMALCVDYKGEFVPTYSQTIPDLANVADFLTNQKSPIFVRCNAIIKAVRLVVEPNTAAPVHPVNAGPLVTDASTAGLLDLRGGAGMPAWLRADPSVLSDADGMTGGEIRTAEQDLINHDFVFDALVKFRELKTRPPGIRIGLGAGNQGQRDDVGNSVYLWMQDPLEGGSCELDVEGGRRTPAVTLGSIASSRGPHLVRLEKIGTKLTVSIVPDYHGIFKPVYIQSTDLSRTAYFLNQVNSHLFANVGDYHLSGVRLVVDGQLQALPGRGVDDRSAAPAAAGVPAAADSNQDAISQLPLISLKGDAGIPSWLAANPEALADADGISPAELHTVDRDLIDKDFTFDFLYRFKPEGRRRLTVGIGGGEHDDSAIGCNIDSPQDGGSLGIFNQNKVHDVELGKTYDDPGPNLFRLSKRGHTLTMAVCVDYTGEFKPTFSESIPDISTDTLLNRTNSGLTLSGEGTVVAVRMIVNGKPPDQIAQKAAANPPVKVATTNPSPAIGPFASLTGPGLPAFFEPQGELDFSHGGLSLGEKTVRTVKTDFNTTQDFTFDVLYHFAADDHQELLIGMGENGRDGGAAWILNSVCARIHGPADNGASNLMVSGKGDIELGHAGDEAGPYLFRLQKHGSALTLAVGIGVKGDFQPIFSKAIPDLAASGPFLTTSNSPLFISGGGIVDQVRLSVNGAFLDPHQLVRAVPGVNATTQQSIPSEEIAKIDEHRLQLPAGGCIYTPGTDGHVLLLVGKNLAILAPDGFTILKKLTLPKIYLKIGERKDYYIALCQEPRSIDIIDKTSLKVIRSRVITFEQLFDLAMSPTLPISYVSYYDRGNTPRNYHFLIFDEITGKARVADQWIGGALAVSPDGKFLASTISANGNSIARYDLDDSTGYPVSVAHSPGSFADTRRAEIRLSEDGKRVTYIYPKLGISRGLYAWNPTDLSELPVAYDTQGLVSQIDLAFHPILPLVACYGKGSVVIFNRETGEKEEGRINQNEGTGERFDRIYFSPDGKWVIVQVTANAIQYLYRVPLKLSDDEMKSIGALPHPDKPLKPHAADVPPPKVTELQANAGDSINRLCFRMPAAA